MSLAVNNCDQINFLFFYSKSVKCVYCQLEKNDLNESILTVNFINNDKFELVKTIKKRKQKNKRTNNKNNIVYSGTGRNA